MRLIKFSSLFLNDSSAPTKVSETLKIFLFFNNFFLTKSQRSYTEGQISSRYVPFFYMGVESHFWVFYFFLVNCLGRWNQSMWLVSCRRQGMLTQGLTPDPKFKLNISSFLTLPHVLDCLNCTRNSVSIILLL